MGDAPPQPHELSREGWACGLADGGVGMKAVIVGGVVPGPRRVRSCGGSMSQPRPWCWNGTTMSRSRTAACRITSAERSRTGTACCCRTRRASPGDAGIEIGPLREQCRGIALTSLHPSEGKPLAHRDITLPKRQRAGGYVEPDLPLRHIPAPF